MGNTSTLEKVQGRLRTLQETSDIDKTVDHDPWFAVALVVGHQVLALAVQTDLGRTLVDVRLTVGPCYGDTDEG